MALKIKKDDIVQVIAGDDKGTKAKVLRVDVENQMVVVEGVNRVYKHVRPSRRNPQGGRLQVERPIHISNVLVVSAGKPTRVKFKVDADGKKMRVDTKGNVVDTIRRADK